jgi:hypothetical protein
MASNYPGDIDTDAELPRVDDNVSEVGAGTLNAMREAIIGIQKALGTDPQGAAADLKTRLATSLNDDGTLKTAALVITSIANSSIAAGAAIEESKLDLAVGTQSLQDQISLNDIDIANLQRSIDNLINSYAQHIAGTGDRHDSYDIDLDSDSPSVTPPEFISLTAINVGTAIIEMNDRFIAHADAAAVGAHLAVNISVDGTSFESIPTTVDDVQEALEELDRAENLVTIRHRDSMHANGFDSWANDSVNNHNPNLQKVPTLFSSTFTAQLISGTRNTIRFAGLTLSDLRVTQGDILVVTDGYAAGSYKIDDVGPRAALGSKPLLNATDLEIDGPFTDRDLVVDGYVEAQIFGASSLFTLKANGAATFYQSSASLDNVQVARPNSAKILSLGAKPNLIDGTETLDLEVGLDAGLVRTISIGSLDEDRSGPVTTVTLDTVIDRLNSVFNGAENFPAAAYRVGDELMLSHNWDGYEGYTIKVESSSTASTVLGLDDFGADIVDVAVPPTNTSAFYVNGYRHIDFATILAATTATASGSTLTFATANPLALGVKAGHLIHISGHSTTTDANGTYLVRTVTATTVTLHTTIAAGTVTAKVFHDAAPLEEFTNHGDSLILEVFLDESGQIHVNNRLEYDKLITNLNIIRVSDNFLASSNTLASAAISGGHELYLGASAPRVFIPTGFIGEKIVWGDSNIEFVVVDIVGPISSAGSIVTVHEHADEESILEICSVRTNGLETLFDLDDKRLFGTTGLDEIREDIVQLYIETPLDELRGDGVVRGFELLDGAYTDPIFPTIASVLLRGGSLYAGGVRLDLPTQPVNFPDVAGTFFIVANALGTYSLINETDVTLEEIFEGNAGPVVPILKVVHSGSAITSTTDLRKFIDNLDEKVEVILDTTNNRIGNFITFEAALEFVNNSPSNEKLKIKIVSKDPIDVTIPSTSRELTVELDGYVNNVYINAPCRLSTTTLSNRTQSHIEGDMIIGTGCTFFEMDNIKVDGYVSVAGSSAIDARFRDSFITGAFTIDATAVDKILCQNVDFSSTFTVSSGADLGRLFVDRCTFNSSALSLTLGPLNNFVEFDNCDFDTCTFPTFSAAVTDEIQFRGCTFRGNTVSSGTIMVLTAPTLFSNCLFTDITTSSTAQVITTTLDLRIQNCIFKDLVLGAASAPGSMLVDVPTSDTTSIISDCLFDEVTFGTKSTIEIAHFDNNRLIGSTNEVWIIANKTYTNNIGFHAMSGQNTMELVSGNHFPNTTVFGVSIDLAYAAGGSPHTVVTANRLDLTTNQYGVQFGQYTRNTTVTNNVFAGPDSANAIAIHLGAAGTSPAEGNIDCVITNNIFDDCASLTTTAKVEGYIFANNQLPAYSGTDQIILGSEVTFAGNMIGRTVELNGGGAYGIAIEANNIGNTTTGLLGKLEINSPLTASTISNNVSDTEDGYVSLIEINGAIDTCIISSNTTSFQVDSGSAPSFTNSIYSDNSVGFVAGSLARITWQTCAISNNYFGVGLSQFKVFSSVGNDEAFVTIEGNRFDDGVTIISDNEIDFVVFADNINLQSSSATAAVRTLTINDHINNSVISKNFNFIITVLDGADGTMISLNNAKEQGNISLAGIVNGTTVNGNLCVDLIIECDSTNGLKVTDNNVFDDLLIFSTPGSHSISNAIFSNNQVVDNISIGDGYGGADTFSFTASTFSGNRCDDIRIFNNGVDTATYVFQDMSFRQNTITNSIKFLDIGGTDAYANMTMDGISINGNIGFFSIGFNGGDFTGSAVTADVLYTNIDISSNQLSGIIWADYSNFDGILISGNTFVGLGSIIQNSLKSIGATLQADNLTVINNTFKVTTAVHGASTLRAVAITVPGGGLTASATIKNLTFSNNLAENFDLIIDSAAAAITDLIIENVVISSNIMRAVAIKNRPSQAAKMDTNGFTIANNIFDGEDGGAGEHVSLSPSHDRGVYLVHSIAAGQGGFNGGNISGNSSSVRYEIRFEDSNNAKQEGFDVIDISVYGNQQADIIFDAHASWGWFTVENVAFVGNVGCTFDMGDLDAGSVTGTGMIGLTIANNACRGHAFVLPELNAFDTGEGNAFTFNTFAWQEPPSTTFTTTGTSLFVWGNQGTFEAGVSFTGTTLRDVTGTNGATITN